jgi:glyoxylase-like metal-dependent hydrolase (beta-lactamase superfamily II)
VEDDIMADLNMTHLNRRDLLLASISTLAAGGMRDAYASAPLSTQQAPAFFRYKVGDTEISTVNDGVSRMPITDDFVRNVPKATVQKALDDLFLDHDFYAGPYNPIFINTGSKLALVDTGTGESAFKSSNGLNGRLSLNMKAANIRAEDVDLVILTHFHGDHINGLIKEDNSLAFPNAEIIAPAKEIAFWLDDGEMARAATPRVKATFENARRVFTPDVRKRLRPYAPNKEIISGISAVETAGHTPGHCSLTVSSGNKTLFVQGDVTHASYLFARHPDWHFMLDVDPVAAEATRRKVYDMLVADKMAVQGFHYPFPAIAHVEKTQEGYREILVPFSPVL